MHKRSGTIHRHWTEGWTELVK